MWGLSNLNTVNWSLAAKRKHREKKEKCSKRKWEICFGHLVPNVSLLTWLCFIPSKISYLWSYQSDRKHCEKQSKLNFFPLSYPHCFAAGRDQCFALRWDRTRRKGTWSPSKGSAPASRAAQTAQVCTCTHLHGLSAMLRGTDTLCLPNRSTQNQHLDLGYVNTSQQISSVILTVEESPISSSDFGSRITKWGLSCVLSPERLWRSLFVYSAHNATEVLYFAFFSPHFQFCF